jgi:hypothetical protein
MNTEATDQEKAMKDRDNRDIARHRKTKPLPMINTDSTDQEKAMKDREIGASGHRASSENQNLYH